MLDINKNGKIDQDELDNPDPRWKMAADNMKKHLGKSKSGGEFEEAVPTKTGKIPWKGMLVGFYLVPGKEASMDPELVNHPLRLDMPRPNTFVKAKQQAVVAEGLDRNAKMERIQHFIDWVYKKERIKAPRPNIELSSEKESEDMHHTGWYNAKTNVMYVYTGNRNLIDILRTIAHELRHRKQGSQGRIHGHSPPGSKLERDADAEAGYLMKLYAKEYPEIIE
jgi:hypothetical protein